MECTIGEFNDDCERVIADDVISVKNASTFYVPDDDNDDDDIFVLNDGNNDNNIKYENRKKHQHQHKVTTNNLNQLKYKDSNHSDCALKRGRMI